MYKSTDPIADIERQEKIEQLQAEEAARAEAEAVAKQRKKLSFGRQLLRFFGWLLLIVVLTSGAAAGVWFLWLKEEKPIISTNNSQQNKMDAPSPPSAKTVDPVDTYSSSRLFLLFDHPKNWKVSEDNKIMAVSPPTKLKTAGGLTQTGEIVLTIRSAQTSLPDFKAGNPTAVIESEKINYARPTQAQRAATYISFLSYAGAVSKGLDGVYVSGDNGYLADQLVPMADIIKANPLITVTFQSCPEVTCAANSARTPLTIATSSWKDDKLAKPIKAMLQSLVVE